MSEILERPTMLPPVLRHGSVLRGRTLSRYGIEGARVSRSIKLPQQVVAARGAAQITAQQFLIYSESDDHLVCLAFNGTELGSGQIMVAKPWFLRRTPFDGQTRNGVTYTYSGSSTRTADNGVDAITEIVVPSWQSSDLVYAVTGILGGVNVKIGSTPLEWLMLADGRAWAELQS